MYWKSDFDPAQHSAYDEEERQPSGFVILFYRKPIVNKTTINMPSTNS